MVSASVPVTEATTKQKQAYKDYHVAARRGNAYRGYEWVPPTIVHIRKVDCDTWNEKIEKQQMAPTVEEPSLGAAITAIVLFILSSYATLISLLFRSQLATKTTKEEVREIVTEVLNNYHERVTKQSDELQTERHKDNQRRLESIEEQSRENGKKLDNAVIQLINKVDGHSGH